MFTDCCHYLLILSIYCAFNLSKLGFFCWGASPGYAAKTRFSAALQLYNIFFTMCFFSAIACFMCSNFSLSNVFTNSNVNTPLLFQISATWSNHEGSLLLWCWLLTFFGRSLDKSKVLYERESLAPRNPFSANTGFFFWGAESGLSFTTFRFCDDAMTSSNLKRPSRTSQTRSRRLSESLEYLQPWPLLGSPHSLSRRGAFRDHLVGAGLDEVLVSDMRRVRSPDVTTSDNAGRNSKVSFKKGRRPKAAQGPMYNIRSLIKTSVSGVYADFNTAIFRGFFRSRCLLIYLFIVLFFALFLLTTSNPFLKNQFLSFNSIAELNPVLQDPVLAIHPPCIYTGYVASAVGFTLCLSRSLYVLHFFGGSLKNWWKMGSAVLRRTLAEVLGRPERDNRPIVSAAQGRLTSAPELCRFFFYDDYFVYNDIWLHIRFWISICWSFLTLGILLGSWWAYHELGWGGWWFWDPVENASLMPWLFATACIHSVLLPRLNYWTLFFNLFTFVLSVLGTFFVRSGLLASVHSFATDSTRGFFLLTFLVCIAALAPLQWFGQLILGDKPRLTTGTPLLKGAWSTGARRSLSVACQRPSRSLGRSLSVAWALPIGRLPTALRPCGPSVSARSALFNTEPAHCARDLRDYLLFSRQLLNEKLLGDPKSSIRAPFCRQTLSGLARRRRPAEQRDKGRGWGNRPQKQIEQLLQLQNCLFLILTGIVLCGTAAPILFQLFSDRDVTTGAPFFNGTIVPLVCCILLMLIFVHCLMLQFCNLKASLLPGKRQFTPKISGVLAQFVYNFLEGLKLSKTSVDYGLACFVLVAITMIFVHFFAFYFVAEFSVLESTYCVLCFTLFCILLLSTSKMGVLGRRSALAIGRLPVALSQACLRPWAKRAIGPQASEGQKAPSAERRTPAKSRSLPAAPFLLASSSNLRAPMASNMKIAHTGLLVFITGVLLSNRKKTHCSLQMRSSLELRLGQKICCLRSIDQNVGPTFRSICGNVIIYQQRLKPLRYGEPFPPTDLKQLKDAFVMFPETRFSFSNPELSTTKVAIHTNLLSDIYMLIGTGSTDSGWFVTTMQLPYIFCIWLGFLLAAIAGFNSIALLLKQQKLNWA